MDRGLSSKEMAAGTCLQVLCVCEMPLVPNRHPICSSVAKQEQSLEAKHHPSTYLAVGAKVQKSDWRYRDTCLQRRTDGRSSAVVIISRLAHSSLTGSTRDLNCVCIQRLILYTLHRALRRELKCIDSTSFMRWLLLCTLAPENPPSNTNPQQVTSRRGHKKKKKKRDGELQPIRCANFRFSYLF